MNNPEYHAVKKEIEKRKELKERQKERERLSPAQHMVTQITPSPVNPATGRSTLEK